MLQTKGMRANIEEHDGLRVSVMSRHTLNDGVTPDPTISVDSYDEWWPELAPPLQLIGGYYKRGLPWDEFAIRYEKYLSTERPQELVSRLVELALRENVTILCTESSPEQCHRRLIAEACRNITREIVVVLR